MRPLTRISCVLFALMLSETVNADVGGKFVDGLISFGRTVGDATKSVVNTFKEWGDRVSPPKGTQIKGEMIQPFFSRVCGHSVLERKIVVNCLQLDERHLLHTDWNKCLGRAGKEVQTFPDLMHWICNIVAHQSTVSGLSKTQDCVVKDVDSGYAMTLYRLCARRLP
ncbi:uncharacterized protein LOC100899148 [Galendromus occidentalis]|uniref:Uncharacterized protein LOC100899148 n=1 Tax=Galendromus occidentalis TaxID=34638 RepID=A0AAJ6QWC6_9ACAR|nr:uncharacterized protein LOC100899148 [Galendromus occidentalis]